MGLGAPYWDMYARGALVGLTRGTTRAHVARATLEAIAYQTRDVLDAMTAEARARPAELRVDGGATENDFLCQFQADILGLPILRPKARETTGLGAAHLARTRRGPWRGPRRSRISALDRRSSRHGGGAPRALYAGRRRRRPARDRAREATSGDGRRRGFPSA